MINWFRRKRNSDKYEIVTSNVPIFTISRWYLYDTDLTENVNELAELIGLTPISEEGELKELEDSDLRIKHMSPLFPYLETISNLSSAALSALHTKELLESAPEEERDRLLADIQGMHMVYKAVALSTLIGAFSIGLELGIISHDTVEAKFMYLGEDNNE